MPQLAERLVQTRELITRECLRLNRTEPTLIVVTKNHPVQLVNDLYALGERDFGENRVQEAFAKFQEFNQVTARAEAKWHLIGQLQTNKVKQALEFAGTIHSVDRESLLDELIKRTQELLSPLNVFIQVNLTEDADRGGVSPSALMSFADRVAQTSSLNLKGLMAVASLDKAPEQDFETVARLSADLRANHPNASDLSIGMSGDYIQALSFGATHLRIGTAITGNRQI
jgi:pyridoxal phosphate enzyme (YggS family)